MAVTLAIGDNIPYPDTNKDLYKRNFKPEGWLDSDKTTPFTDTIATGFTGTKTIYVSWTDRDCNYTLRYVSLDKDTTSPTMSDETKSCSEEFNLSSNRFTKLGYEFIGWDTSEDANTVVYKENEKVKELGNVDEVVTLYAVWMDKTYIIRFYDANGAYQGYKTFTYNGTTTIMSNVVPIGKVDAGYIYRDGTNEIRFYSGQRVSKYDFNITNTSSIFDLYGNLADKIYIATFDANGGRFSDGSSKKNINITYGATINYPSVSRNNYTFENWLLNGSIFRNSTWRFDDDRTFVASWKENKEDKDDKDKGRNYVGGSGVSSVDIDRSVNFIMETPIYENEYTFILDNVGNKIGVALNNESKVGKALFYSYFTKDYYSIIGNTNTIKLLNGMYKIYYGGIEHYFAFDKNGNIITGFIEASNRTRMLVVSDNTLNVESLNVELANRGYKLTSDKVFFEKAGDNARFYLYENYGPNRGIMWKEPIVVNGITYTFDIFGRVISSFDMDVNQGIWEYNPNENKWKYFVPDTNGKITYYKDGMASILYNGRVYTYAFDENGFMYVGNFTYKGNTYYAEENGPFKGQIIRRE